MYTVRDEILAPDRLPLFDLWYDKIDTCRVLPPSLPEGLDEDVPWTTVRAVREHQEHDVGASNVGCKSTSMETFMYNKFG
jgi:hypothetical protein